MNTEQRIADLQKQLDELKASLDKKEDGLWYPDDDYWYIDSDGEILDSPNDNARTDVDRFKIHNVFQSQEQAERHAKRLKLYNKLWRIAEYLNKDWVPDYEKKEGKWYIYFDYNEDIFRYSCRGSHSYGDVVFKSEDLAERAISMLTDEEKEIFKNIYRP